MPNDSKRRFVHQLAVFLAGDQVRMSIELEMGTPLAEAWVALRRETPLSGYPTLEQAEEQLADFLRVS